jgi:hypothetical protein
MKKKHTKNEKLLIDLKTKMISLRGEVFALAIELEKLEKIVAGETLTRQVVKSHHSHIQ